MNKKILFKLEKKYYFLSILGNVTWKGGWGVEGEREREREREREKLSLSQRKKSYIYELYFL
jgi:hypothetical protein